MTDLMSILLPQVPPPPPANVRLVRFGTAAEEEKPKPPRVFKTYEERKQQRLECTRRWRERMKAAA